MKKRLLIILSIGIITLSLSSCSFIHVEEKKPTDNYDSTKPWLTGKTVKGHNFTYDITTEKFEELTKEMKKAKEYASEDSHYDYFYDVYTKLESFYYEARAADQIEFLEYSLYGNPSNLDKEEEFSNMQTDILQWYNEVEHIAYSNSFKEKLWEGKTDEEILELIGKPLPDEYYELSRKMNSLENDFNLLDMSDYDFFSKAENIYVQFVDVANKRSKYLDYDNYLDYAYQNVYGRDYTAKDTDDFFKYVVEYLVPYANKLTEELETDFLSSSERKKANDFFNGNAFTEDNFGIIEGYKEHMGGIVEEAYDNLFKEDGCYFISYSSDGYDGAYQSTIQEQPYVFYGDRYHDYCHVIHEFGHYTYAFKGESLQSFDLLETHSQGGEVMFLNYYLKNYLASDYYKKVVRDLKIIDFAQAIVMCSIINELEKVFYTSDEFKIGDFEKELRRIYNENSGLESVYPFDYMLLYASNVVVTSACYYISYATSMIGSLYLEKLAYNDFDKAKESYLKLFTYENCNSYREVYEYAGIEDPFKEELFKFIVE